MQRIVTGRARDVRAVLLRRDDLKHWESLRPGLVLAVRILMPCDRDHVCRHPQGPRQNVLLQVPSIERLKICRAASEHLTDVNAYRVRGVCPRVAENVRRPLEMVERPHHSATFLGHSSTPFALTLERQSFFSRISRATGRSLRAFGGAGRTLGCRRRTAGRCCGAPRVPKCRECDKARNNRHSERCDIHLRMKAASPRKGETCFRRVGHHSGVATSGGLAVYGPTGVLAFGQD